MENGVGKSQRIESSSSSCQFRDRVYQIAHYNWDAGTARVGAADARITVRPARILFLWNHNSGSRYIESNYTAIVGRMSLELVEQEWTVGASLHAYVHARRNDNAFSRRCSRRRSPTDRFSYVCVCVCVHRLVLFTHRSPAARHERSRASGNPPPPIPVHPVTEPPTLDTPESAPGSTYPRHFRDELFRSTFTFSRSLFGHLSSFPRRSNARVCRFNKNLLTSSRYACRKWRCRHFICSSVLYYRKWYRVMSMISSSFTYTYNYINK